MSERLFCSICQEPIRPEPVSGWAHGCNAQPVNDGRCCAKCDQSIVIPARIRLLMRSHYEAEQKKAKAN